ncbi:DUF4338 domain-containing protein [Variovorax sp. LjRoot84]|uniref:Druantia anti-phage system protein DruA n=1 Tax=Variovorax sp. LjRoot84 TaxID=3342340 RepID=UPI003ECC36D4
MKRYCGRDFTDEDLHTIVQLIERNPQLKRAPLSRLVCERLNWVRPDGRLKDMTCRVAMLRMQADGLLTLPASQMGQHRRRPEFLPTPHTDARPVVTQPVHELGAIQLHTVAAGHAQSRRWNEYMARYHYLGYTPMSGSQMRYYVYAGEQLVALLSFGASAWKLSDRERFIGWSESQRQKNLQLVVNNARFLILPWIQCKGLASKILALAARQLPREWHQRYGYRPVLLETFVESPRHRGTCYKAANWVHVGQTVGRGKKSRVHSQIVPIKDIWLYPLRKDFGTVLCQ